MIAIVMRLVRDREDAADVFQEVLATVWAKLSHIHRHPNPHAYILKICVNHSYESASRAGTAQAPRGAAGGGAHRGPGGAADGRPEDDRDVEALVRAAVLSLPVQQAQAVLLRLLDGESYPVISRILECSEITARSTRQQGAGPPA
jgi:RNA polymerase sigma factor (sigma-70 family)